MKGGRESHEIIRRTRIFLLCIACFFVGTLFTNRVWFPPESGGQIITRRRQEEGLKIVDGCTMKRVSSVAQNFVMRHIFVVINCQGYAESPSILSLPIRSLVKTEMQLKRFTGPMKLSIGHSRILDNAISTLQMELAASRRKQENSLEGLSPVLESSYDVQSRKKAFVVIGINTAFSSRKRRDSIRETWMPQGEKLMQLEQEKGIVVRFMIGHSATSNSILDKAIDSEDAQHNDFLRLDHVEGYHELSAKTKTFFSTAVANWDADFYVKVDDDVHVNLGMLAATLAQHRSKPRVYIGCMKSGPVLSQKNVKYHEPEYWKFGEEGNNYFRHATGQIYAISKDLATYISINQHILHKYANEDVSLGSWFIGLDVEQIDERNMCCGTPPDCEWKAQAGNVCIASFDWGCSGICKSVEKIKDVHARCGEGVEAVWSALF